MDNFFGLIIGNSHLHWAQFQDNQLGKTWKTPHLPTDLPVEINLLIGQNIPLYLASVVPTQTVFWQEYFNLREITLKNIPLKGLYPTLGIDRALAVLGAAKKYGLPCLVIDGGTALTLTGVDTDDTLVGGAILPGLGLQIKSLNRNTAALPSIALPLSLPPRWAQSTEKAIESGIIYTFLAGLKEFIGQWWCRFPDSQVLITGGDGEVFYEYLKQDSPEIITKVKLDPYLIFCGLVTCIE